MSKLEDQIDSLMATFFAPPPVTEAEYEITMGHIASEMADQAPSTPRQLLQHDIASRLSTVLTELDGLITLSRDFDAPDIQRAICAEEIAFWQVMTKAQLICSFIEASKPQGLRLVKGTRR